MNNKKPFQKWHLAAYQSVSAVIKANPGLDKKSLRKKIQAAYPFGERNYHPYKVWLKVVKKELDRLFPDSEGADLGSLFNKF